MTVTIETPTGTKHDITGRLFEADDVVLTQELERDAFERVVSDLHLVLTNMDGFFTDLFATALATTKFRVEVSEGGRVNFRGIVDMESVEFSLNNEYVTMDVFSNNKAFWDLAKSTRINKGIPLHLFGMVRIDLKSFFEQILFHGSQGFFDIFPIFDLVIDPLYASRLIRFAGTTTDPSIGNNGRYQDLDRSTTVADLLGAMSLYYNAEFFIDPATGKFNMQQRGKVLNDIELNLDDILREDTEIVIDWLDDRKYDYLYTFGTVPLPESPIHLGIKYQRINLSVLDQVITPGVHTFRMSVLIAGVEAAISDPIVATATRDELLGNLFDIGYPIIRMPTITTLPGIETRRLYMSLANSQQMHLIHEVHNNTDVIDVNTLFRSNTALLKLPVLPYISNALNMWIRFNESTQQWEDRIIDYGEITNVPQGKIFDVRPRLRFHIPDNPSVMLDENMFDTWSFFGREKDYLTLQKQYEDMFLTKRRLRIPLKGINYNVGDSAVSHKMLFSNDLISKRKMVLKKVTTALIREESNAEYITA